MNADDVHRRAQAWLDQDPDPQTRAELRDVMDAAAAGDAEALADLHDRFTTRLGFGTAGLRGRLGAGSNRMNRVLVAQAAAGLAAYLLRRAVTGTVPTVVIGYDGRRNSRVFAQDSAEIMAGAGLHAVLLPRLLPTPVLAFAVRHLHADAGVMVTASHNPRDDNGYKVYLGGSDGGSQIVPPADVDIAACIRAVAASTTVPALPRRSDYATASQAVVDAYVKATASVAPVPAAADTMRWVYTAMHGVGWETMSHVLRAAGYPQPVTVAAQIEPDAAFPTVAFPNPEESGALDLAFQTAREQRAQLVIANDPDADRLAVGIPDPASPGGWRRLDGNEVGLLLGWRAAQTAAPGSALACSVVSSPGLAAVAAHHGLAFHATLTGFKWISRAPGLAYGFEEALGYLVDPDTVHDKDGISAALAILQVAGQAHAAGRGIQDLLDDMAAHIGCFASDQVSLRVDDISIIARIMAALRYRHPVHVGGVGVARTDDFTGGGVDGLPASDILRFRLVDGSQVLVRPSGTEPKLKVYVHVCGQSRQDAASRLGALRAGVDALLEHASRT